MPLQWLRGRFAYTPLQTDDAAFSGSLPWKGRPSPTIFTLRQLKLAAFTILGLLLLSGVGVYNRDQIEAIRAAYSTSQHDESPDVKSVDWSRFAYVQYVTNKDYLCNSVMFFERLKELESKADRVLMYPSVMLADPHEKEHEDSSDDAKLLILAREKYNVKLDPISVQHRTGSDPTWADSFTKLLAFNQTKYDRVLSIDSDSTLLQHMDELFSLPPTTVAMPLEFTRIASKINNAGRNDYDMELVNELYQDSAMVLPHRPYDLLTGEFSKDNHQWYLGSDEEAWDPVAAYNEAKLLHFSDWPLPKPWLDAPENLVREREPKCVAMMDGLGSCAARDIWRGIYEEFRERRKRVCDTSPPETLENGRRRR
ncbi:glucose N-acetyltransferase [Colletotrichum tamarilloi]|uniref:Glucose N-acetyltransferase n=1 Tax=Colletotrichum tamarilloi TaxID=1209934 RepID=A0ABQ9RCM2_9PEZI|nr:glucose N-acetyltransferase [Colletotrichum tamarilloi]KAK1501224.1 glucose N-acetyltransferase [Colletotrichum tamarilloi]